MQQDKTSNPTFFQWNEFGPSAGLTAGLGSVRVKGQSARRTSNGGCALTWSLGQCAGGRNLLPWPGDTLLEIKCHWCWLWPGTQRLHATTWISDYAIVGVIVDFNSSVPSPREPHALAWGPSSFHTKIFRVERTRLKTIEKITDSL